MAINYACSLGTHCQASQILINNNLKRCSYPFDWIFSDCNIISHCLEDDFKMFLDKSYYINIKQKVCGHSYYNKHMFGHHNPLIDSNDYNYYIRCVDRFKQLLNTQGQKLFIMIYVNMDNVEESLKNTVIDFNTKLSKHTQNYKLLCIFHIKKKHVNHHNFVHHDNIDFLELHTLSESDGVNFTNNMDNIYLNNIINTTYTFDIKN